MINAFQFRELILRPVLREMDSWSESAENLLVMTMAHESNGGEYLEQTNHGPAWGIYQMEKGTFNDLWERYLSEKPDLVKKIMDVCNLKTQPKAEEMAEDLALATAMARVYYLRIREPIPEDLDAMSVYAKKYWNTEQGKATAIEYLSAYLRFQRIS